MLFAILHLISFAQILICLAFVCSFYRIGFLGLGLMGSGIVSNLLKMGHVVTVWNRTAEKVPLIPLTHRLKCVIRPSTVGFVFSSFAINKLIFFTEHFKINWT